MQRKMFGYLKYKFTDEELEEVVADLIAHLKDPDAKVMKVFFEEILAKIYFQGNENLWFWDNRTNEEQDENSSTFRKFNMNDSLCDRDDIGKEGTIDSNLGNVVRGSDASLSGQEELMKDPEFKDAYFDLLREAGKMMSSTFK